MLPPLVADINIAPTVIQFLRERGVDVVSAREVGWSRYEDSDILREAYEMGRFVLTHDADFGELGSFSKSGHSRHHLSSTWRASASGSDC